MSDQIYIYGLRSDQESAHAYIGQTANPSARLHQHISDLPNGATPYTPKQLWVESVIQSGGKIVMDILEECTTDNNAERELHWIKTSLAAGHQLTNSSLLAQARFELYIQALYAGQEPNITDEDIEGELAPYLQRIETALYQNGSTLRAICAKFNIVLELPDPVTADRQ